MKQLQDSRRKFLISVKCKTKKADLYLHSVSIYNARRYIFFCTELLLYRLSEEWKTRGQGYDEVHYVTGTQIMPFECQDLKKTDINDISMAIEMLSF